MLRLLRSSLLAFMLFFAAAVPAAEKAAAPQYGPVVCHSVSFIKPANKDADGWDGATTRGINVALPGGATICYDAERLAVAAMWHGGFLDTTGTHHFSYKGGGPPRPAKPPVYLELKQPGWMTASDEWKLELSAFQGYYLHGDRVALAYRIAERDVLESPTAHEAAIGRSFSIAAGQQALSLLVGKIETATAKIDGPLAKLTARDKSLSAALRGDAQGLTLRADGGALYVDIPASDTTRKFVLWTCAGTPDQAAALAKLTEELPAATDPTTLTVAGPRRWTREVTTAGTLGDDSSAYAVDEIAMPDKPYGLWMRLSAIDFFADGRCAVATMAGDVWIVSWPGDDISTTTWQRFATGLYEPLGLKIVAGQVLVRGRDRITKLHDANNDGEVDFYEQFHAFGPIGPGYHAFVFDLVTDKQGNFYYVIGGRKSPSIGEVVKLSPDGKSYEVVSTYFRCPNGMGCGGPHDWVTIADNPDGKFPSGACIVRPGQSYGEEGGPRTEPFLYLLPPKVDSSSGSQGWTDAKRFGPLSGVLIHTSYSTSSLSYVVVQDSKPNPSGFAVHLPFGLKSGAMRLAVSPRDGQMYIAGQRGWDTNAAIDGALSRMRYTGKAACLLTAARATTAGIELTFSSLIDKATANYDNFSAARVSEQINEEVEIDDVEPVDDRTVLVRLLLKDIDPKKSIDVERTKKDKEGRTHYVAAPPLAITFSMKAADGTAVKETVYCTINGLE